MKLEIRSVIEEVITTVVRGQVTEVKDVLAVEEPLEISLSLLKANPVIKKKNISITMRTPGHDVDLALGFLFTEGIIESFSQVDDVRILENKIIVLLNNSEKVDLSQMDRNFYTSSSCGVCGKASIDSIRTVCRLDQSKEDLSIDSDLILNFPRLLREHQQVFRQTGGIHAAAAFDEAGNLLSVREDVGRHNALDKLIGHYFQEGEMPLSRRLILLSGRSSFELIQKAAMAGIQIVMAVGAPSSLALQLAREFNITLVGFLKHDKYNIYHDVGRIRRKQESIN